jgi:hypothetical protein
MSSEFLISNNNSNGFSGFNAEYNTVKREGKCIFKSYFHIVLNRPYTCVFAVQIVIIIVIIIVYCCNYFRGSLFSDWSASLDQVLAGLGSLSVVSVTYFNDE